MDISDELNRLLAELKRVTTREGEPQSSDRRPSEWDTEQFLSQYGFHAEVTIERIEITERGVFQFYMFAVWQPDTEQLSLLVMRR
jgi:hypothetical protein